MKKKILLTSNNRIGAVTDLDFSAGEKEIVFDFPDGFDFEQAINWKIVDGELVHDPLPEPEEPVNSMLQRLEEQELALLELAEMIVGGDA